MKSYKVKYKKAALKFINKNKVIGIKFYKAFLEIAEGKIKYYDVKHLKGKEEFRLRIGKNRAIFHIIEEDIVIIVINKTLEEIL